MRKIIVLLLLLVSLPLFAVERDLLTEYFNYSLNSVYPANAKRVLFGDIELLNEGLSDFDLAVLSNDDLRVLRNMIYARHGHIFDSEDLKAYFSSFNWYVPEKKVSDSELSVEELKLVERISLFETRDETKRDVQLHDVAGIWQDTPIMAAGWSDRFAFYPDGKFEFRFSQMNIFPAACKYVGTYRVKGNVLIFSVNEIYYGEVIPEYKSLTGYWDFETLKARENMITFSEPLIMKFPIVSLEFDKVLPYPDLVRDCLEFGNVTYYKYTDNPDGE